MVPAGSLASLARPCASTHNLAASIGPSRAERDGRCEDANSRTTFSILSSLALISLTLVAQSFRLAHSASVGPSGGIPMCSRSANCFRLEDSVTFFASPALSLSNLASGRKRPTHSTSLPSIVIYDARNSSEAFSMCSSLLSGHLQLHRHLFLIAKSLLYRGMLELLYSVVAIQRQVNFHHHGS